MNTKWFVSDPTDKIPKDCAEHVDGLCFENCLRMNIDMNMSLWFCGGNLLLKSVQAFWIILYTKCQPLLHTGRAVA